MRGAGGGHGIRACIVVTAIALFTIEHAAAVPIFSVSGTISQSYNDNVGLVAQGQRPAGDWITALTPQLSISDQGRRVQFDLSYSPTALFFAGDTSLATVQQNLLTSGQVELLKDTFFVREQASIIPQFINGAGAVGPTTYTTNSNLQSTTAYQISPYLRHRFGYITDAETSFIYGQVSASGETLAPLQNEELRQTFTSGTYFGRLGWTLTADARRDRIGAIPGETTSSGVLKDDLARADLKYVLVRGLAVTASGGYEDISFPPTLVSALSVPTLVPALRGPTWNAGFDYTPNPRFSFTATYGSRYGAPDYEVSAKYTGAITNATLTYTETIETTSMMLLSSVGGLGFVNGLGINTTTGLPFTGNSSFGNIPAFPSTATNSPFLGKFLTASLQRTLERNTFTAYALYGTERIGAANIGNSSLGTVTISASPITEAFYTASLSWARNILPDLSGNLSASYTHSNFGVSAEYAQTYSLLGSLAYTLSAFSALTFSVAISHEQSNVSAIAINNDIAIISYRRRF